MSVSQHTPNDPPGAIKRRKRVRNVALCTVMATAIALIAGYLLQTEPQNDEKIGGARIVDANRVRTFIQRGELTGREARFYDVVQDAQ